MTSHALTVRGLWALTPVRNESPALATLAPVTRTDDVAPILGEAGAEDFPYAFDTLAPRLPLRALQMRRAIPTSDCDSCITDKSRWIIFAHDLPRRPGHWSAVYRVCDRCAPPADLSEVWRSQGGGIDP